MVGETLSRLPGVCVWLYLAGQLCCLLGFMKDPQSNTVHTTEILLNVPVALKLGVFESSKSIAMLYFPSAGI